MAELKPCPFCGGEAILYRMKRDSRKRMGVYHMIATIKCTECTAQVSQAGYSEERAIEFAAGQWNRRTKVEVNFYDKEETYPNCTVQVLTNTVTGDVSVGWWKNGGNEDA